jgi:pSer/pThr/pTyr-binding forkhead associated (FHA) protein
MFLFKTDSSRPTSSVICTGQSHPSRYDCNLSSQCLSGAEGSATMPRSLTIGSKPDCDLVVNVPSVSGHHCRVTYEETGFTLEDLDSTNGTYLNGERIIGPARVTLSATDTIHLGSHSLSAERVLALIKSEPGPTLSLRGAEMVIGRNPSCDQVIDLPMVSSRHARLFRSGDQVLIEDLGSSNGTFVNGTRVEKPVVVNAGDVIGLGSYTTVLDTGSWRRAEAALVERASVPTETSVPTFEFVSEESLVALPGDEVESTAGILSHPWLLVALLVQAPLAALLIIGLVGTRSPAPILFWIGLAATWFGLSNAVLGNLLHGTELRTGLTPAGAPALVSRVLVLGVFCLLQCLLAWVIIANVAALKAAGLPALALLILTSAVGLALGLLILALAPRPVVAWAILPAALLVLWLFGGGWQPLARLPVLSSIVPSRWTFEGLLLLESEQRSGPGSADRSAPSIDHDLAEEYFPAETDRMGVKADALALTFILIGLTAAALFTSASSKPDRWRLQAH